MRLRPIALLLAGSVAVNFAVACASNTAARLTVSELDADSIADAVVDAIADAAIDAVSPPKDADAAPSTDWAVDEVLCVTLGSGARVAAKAYPGRSMDDLARGVAIICNDTADADGYRCNQVPMQVKAGEVRVSCFAAATRARFITPTL